ncbi:response regulator [Niveispirillum sp. KHB5.9]|uniref:response regulator n=1 Tax=Niveispirillum sp. KHB5.9 TaxID=3400269 RepID=UPI003A888907
MNPLRDGARLRVLLAEDNAFEARLIQGVLRQLGVGMVAHHRDGAGAMSAVTADMTPFDLVISDWNMPNGTGLDLLRHVRDVWKHTPFLMLTAHATVDFVKAAKANAVDAYLVKPFAPRDLAGRITQLLSA